VAATMLKPKPQAKPAFSLSADTLQMVLEHAKPLGHHEDAANLNLGFGFLYYSLVRALRPQHVVVIGSGFGFSVVCLALGIRDNGEGAVTFVDPSYSVFKNGPLHTVGGTAQWDDPTQVTEHFRKFGVERFITHFKMTSEEFFDSYSLHDLPSIDLAFIDGNHSFADVRHDFLAALRHTHRNTYMLLHDTNIYVRELVRHAGVKRWLKRVSRAKEHFEVIDFPFSSGVALVRVLREGAWEDSE
jgi:predicted O-methyltransferase YrrM